jgi:thioredoxin-dependent peroxiredoxin
MTTLKVGDKAPTFKGINQKGESITLDQLKGKKVVLYFYPKDSTPGCTAQACNLSDNIEHLKKHNIVVLGVSADDTKSHTKFIDKYNLQFDLLADTDKSIIQAYGCWGPKQFMGKKFDGIHRTTFVIDENGIISQIIDKVNTKDHFAQIEL